MYIRTYIQVRYINVVLQKNICAYTCDVKRYEFIHMNVFIPNLVIFKCNMCLFVVAENIHLCIDLFQYIDIMGVCGANHNFFQDIIKCVRASKFKNLDIVCYRFKKSCLLMMFTKKVPI